MYGGLTGFGHPSLGGLLLGGARTKISDMDNAQLTAYKLARGQKKMLAKRNLKELIDAERFAEYDERMGGHPDIADYLHRDLVQNEKIYDHRLPMWAANEYSYNTLFQPRIKGIRKQLTEAEKIRLMKDRKALKLIREQSNIPKIVNPKTGRVVYIDSAIGQRILKARSVLQRLAPQRGVSSGSIGLSMPQRRALPAELSAQLRLPRTGSVRNPSSGRYISTSNPEFLGVSSSDF
jgi:hypothetical protein